MYFRYFMIISPLKKVWALHLKIVCVKSVWNEPSGSGDEDEHLKSLRQRQQQRRTTYRFWSDNITWVFGSVELKNMHEIPKSSKENLVIHTMYHSWKMTQKEAQGPHCSPDKEYIWTKFCLLVHVYIYIIILAQ